METFQFKGNKDEILLKKNDIVAIKSIISSFCSKSESEIIEIINNNFLSLSEVDKAILREIALTTRATSKAIKYMWTMMK